MVGKRFPIGNAYSYTVNKVFFLSVYVDDNRTLIRCGNYSTKKSILGEPTSFLDHVYLGCTQRQCEISKDIVDNYITMCLNREFQRVEEKSFHTLKIFVFLHGLMIWKVMQRNVWSDFVSWRTKRLNNSTKYLPPMHRRPPLQRRRNEDCWRIVTCMLSNCSEMLILG